MAFNPITFREKGWIVLDNLFSLKEISLIKEWAVSLELKKANIKNNGSLDLNYRGDLTHWLNNLDSEEDIEKMIFKRFNMLKKILNHNFFMNVTNIESQIAYYPPNQKYGKHLDSFKRNNNRVVSLVTYLNEDWKEGQGGELRIYEGKNTIDISPCAGKSVMFLSSEIDHEVLETYVDRWSIATWFLN